MNIWPFRRRNPAPEQPPETNHAWRVGDLGECIMAQWLHAWPDNPKVGDIVKVSALVMYGPEALRPGLYLRLGNHDERCWNALAFRKIVIQHEPASAEFTASLRDRKPVPVLEPAGHHQGD